MEQVGEELAQATEQTREVLDAEAQRLKEGLDNEAQRISRNVKKVAKKFPKTLGAGAIVAAVVDENVLTGGHDILQRCTIELLRHITRALLPASPPTLQDVGAQLAALDGGGGAQVGLRGRGLLAALGSEWRGIRTLAQPPRFPERLIG